MTLEPLHRRLAVGMALAALVAFAGGAGVEPLSAGLAAAGLILAFFWQPRPTLSDRLDRAWLAGAAVLSVRAVWHVVVVGDDIVVPIVDLLFLLMVGEALRSDEGKSDPRLYALSFALLLAATAYRPGVLFASAFVAYVVLATLALTVGHLRREAEVRGTPEPRLGRPFFVATLGVSLVTLLVSGFVFMAFPRVPRGWAGRGPEALSTMAGFGDQVALDAFGAEIGANPQVVLRVEFPDGPPRAFSSLHWKGRTYDHFDGVRWSRSPLLSPAAPSEELYMSRWATPLLRYRVFAAPLEERVIFGLHPLIDVRPTTAIRPVLLNSGDYAYWGGAAPAYEALSLARQPPPPALRAASEGPAPAARFYLQLPPMSLRVAHLADSLTAGAATRYDRAVAIQRWLQTEFRYTTRLPATRAETGLEHFLFERRAGHCEYFSTAMVVLLRNVGIASRNVNGFLGGDWNHFGDYLAVTQNNAHSWVEAWFPGLGWVTFDPTPAAAAEGRAAASWSWPGRFMLDGLEHRWNKWVLDYDLGMQVSLFRAAGEAVRGRSAEGAEEEVGFPWRGVVLGLLISGALLAAFHGARRRGEARPPLARGYLRLRRLYARSRVLSGPEARGPLAFMHSLERADAPGLEPAGRVVDLYVRSRFAGETLGDDAVREQARALRHARRALRAAR